MPKIAYTDINLSEDRRVTIIRANEIIDEYNEQGYTLTLRQLYYQFVSRDLIPNNDASYKRLGATIATARDTGRIDWFAIEDRGRGISPWLIEEDEQEVLSGIEEGFALDYWQRQNTYVEVWVEKDALSSVIRRPCERLRVPFMACKGYLSASEAWRSGRRFRYHAAHGRRCVMIHLGDHDPSGIDMTRDNEKRLNTYSEGADIEVRRIALNMDQVTEHRPPPNPAKITDSRARDYIVKYGRTSWELDALEPSILDKLISAEVEGLIDPEVWEKTRQEEEERRELLSKLHDRYEDIADHVRWLEQNE